MSEEKKQGASEDKGQKNEEVQIRRKKGYLKIIKERSLAVIVGLIAVTVIFGCGWYSANQGNDKEIGEEKAEKKIVSFVEENMLQPGMKVEVKGVATENDAYKIVFEVEGEEATFYLSKDGEVIFPSAVNIAEFEQEKKEVGEKEAQAANVEIPKSPQPKVEAFVMSYCPYGTQVQKGFLSVIEALEDKIDFEFKFVDYAMHGEEEIEENVRQYCIGKNESGKLLKYLSCFLESEDSATCLKTVGINVSKLASCASVADREFGIDAKLKDKSTWKGSYPPFDVHKNENETYNVQGSPTIVINGVTVQSKRDPQSLLGTICRAFEDQPEVCQGKLSSSAPAPGFGSGQATTPSDGSCN